MSTAAEAPEQRKAVSLGGWKKAATHTVRLPSGVYVDIKLPDVAQMIESGAIPQHLLSAALAISGSQKQKELTKEDILEEAEFTAHVITHTVVNPKVSLEDTKDIPAEDKVMLVELATRQRDMDAEYNHIAGLHTSESFRRFRGLSGLDEDVEDAA
jgi:hypothetical protein